MPTDWRYQPGGPAMSPRVRQQIAARQARMLDAWRRDPARELALLVLLVVTVAVLFVFAVSIKRLRFDTMGGGDDGTFWMESAQRFRYVREVWAGRGIPEVDRMVQWPQGLRPWTDTVLQEEIYGSLARRMGVQGPDLAAFVRSVTRVVSASALLPMALLAWAVTRRRDAALFGAAAWAFALPVAERGTGTVLFREDLAVPFYLWHLATLLLFTGSGGVAWALISGAAFAMTALTWKVGTFLLLAWDLWAAFCILRGNLEPRRLALGMALFLLPLGAASFLPQHLAETHFLRSTPWLLACALTGAAALRAGLARGSGPQWLVAGVVAFGILRWALPREIGLDHAWETLEARLRLGLSKPEDPSTLPFHVRHYWTGNYGSPSAARLARDWPPLLLLALPGAWTVLRFLRRPTRFDASPPPPPPRQLWQGRGVMERPAEATLDALVLTVLTGIVAYLTFRKFQLFAAASLAVLAAAGFAALRRFRTPLRTLMLGGLGLVAAHGAGWVPTTERLFHLQLPADTWSAVRVFPPGAFDDLVQEVARRTEAGEGILASFVTSPFFLTYDDRPTPLHCFFEGDLLPLYKEVTEAKFAPEDDFWALTRRLRVSWVVVEAHHLLRTDPRMSERYVAGRMDWPHDSVQVRMQFAPEELRHFELAWENAWFRLYRVLPEGVGPKRPPPSDHPMWSRPLFRTFFGDPLAPAKATEARAATPQDLLTATLKAEDRIGQAGRRGLLAPLLLERERSCQIAASEAPWLPGAERCLVDVYEESRRPDRALRHRQRETALVRALRGQGPFPDSLRLSPEAIFR
jgi:hypothetical protein